MRPPVVRATAVAGGRDPQFVPEFHLADGLGFLQSGHSLELEQEEDADDWTIPTETIAPQVETLSKDGFLK